MASICFKHPLRMNGMHRIRIKLRNMKYNTNRDLQHFTSFHCPARHVVSSTLPRAFHRKGLKKPWQLKQVSSSRRGGGGSGTQQGFVWVNHNTRIFSWLYFFKEMKCIYQPNFGSFYRPKWQISLPLRHKIMYFSQWNPYSLINLKPETGTTFGQSLPYRPL